MGKRAALIVVSMLAALAVPTGASAVGEVTCDFNGDGRGEYLVASSTASVDGVQGAGLVEVRYSTATGVPASPDLILDRSTAGVKGAVVADGNFGAAGTCGDFNGDGYDDFAIASPGDEVNGMAAAGAVNVIPGSASGLDTGPDQLWHQNKKGVKSAAVVDERWGEALTSGDFNGDGYDDLVIGASRETVGGNAEAGAVNVLYGTAGGLDSGPDDYWHQNKKGIKGVADAGERFGIILATGDFNGDDRDDLAVGVIWDDVNGVEDAGAVNVVYGSNDGLTAGPDEYWHQDQKGIKEVAEAQDYFGNRIATGDFNGDGYDDLAVGVGFEDRIAINDGVVHVIFGSSTGLDRGPDELWHQDKKGIKDVSQDRDFFGFGLAAGDFNGDGRDDLAIGIWEDIGGATDSGAVSVIPGSSGGLDRGPDQFWHQNKKGVDSAPAELEKFGFGLVARDYDGDGFEDLIIAVSDECGGYLMYGSGGSGLSTADDQCIPSP